jgi:hypothetical protein
MIRVPAREDGAERVGVLGIAVPDQELQAASLFAEVQERIPRRLNRPVSGRVSGDASQAQAAVLVLDGEQHVEPEREDGVEVRKSTGAIVLA